MKKFTAPWLVFLVGIIAVPLHAKVYSALKDESMISYHMVHRMHEVTGVSKNFKCVVDLAADSSKSRVYVKASIAEFNSGNSSRDANMLEVTEAAKYPFVEFASDSVRREGESWRVYGRLAFHGIRKSMSFLVKPETADNKVRIKGSFDISLTEFKIERPKLLMIPVDDALGIAIDVAAKTN